MGISPPTDIVSDVLSAADPARVRQARANLSALAAGSVPTALSPVRGGLDPAIVPPRGFAATEAMLVDRANDAALHRTGRPFASVSADGGRAAAGGDVLAAFEAVTLSTFVKAMLPEDGGASYGRGLAGDFFRQMFAEEIAREIARAGGVGIADAVAARLDLDGPPAGPAAAAGEAEA